MRLTKGTGENSSKNPYKKIKDMPYWTIREQKQVLKEISKDDEGKDKKSSDSANKKKTIKDSSQKRTAKDSGIDLTKKQPLNKRDQTIEDALARNDEMLKQRQFELEAAQVEDDGGGQSRYGSLDVEPTEINAALVAYYEEIKRKINNEWITTPRDVEEGQNLITQINVIIDAGGGIISTTYEQRSGDVSFDMSAMRAIERATPFPSPPEEIKNEIISEGFLIEFNPGSVVKK